MLLRHALPFNIKIIQDKINFDEVDKIKNELNDWFTKKLFEFNKPIKNIKLLTGEYDMGRQLSIGLAVELED